LREYALDRRVELDRGLARPEAVRALVRVLPADKRLAELTALLKHPKATESARHEVVRQLGALGRAAVPMLREMVSDKEVGLEAMAEMLRFTAPRRWAQPPTILPLKQFLKVSELEERLGFPVKIDGLENFAQESIYPDSDKRAS